MDNFIISNSKESSQELCGNKAHNLFILEKLFKIPPFIVISTNAFKVKDSLEQDFWEFLEQERGYLFKNEKLIVRSSSTMEDSEMKSFAGQYNSTLNVDSKEKLVEAIKKTWESAYVENPYTKNYCTKDDVNVLMGVIIQKQINPSISGILATRNPLGDKSILIECTKGLGDNLASGLLNPTSYKIINDIIHCTGEDILNRKDLYKLFKIGRKCEKYFNSPQDIEWCICDNTIYIVQCRPIRIIDEDIFSNANFRETIPNPISQMGWSIWNEILFTKVLVKSFKFIKDKKYFENNRIVKKYYGRLYFNLNNLCKYLYFFRPFINEYEILSKIDEDLILYFNYIKCKKDKKIKVNRLGVIRYKIDLFSFFVKVIFSHEKVYDNINAKLDLFHSKSQNLVVSSNKLEGIKNVEAWLNLIIDEFIDYYFIGQFLSGFYYHFLEKILIFLNKKEGKLVARRSVIGIIDKTGEMAILLEQLVSAIKNIQDITHLDKADLINLFEHSDISPLFSNFILEYGHRGPFEFDIANKTFGEDFNILARFILIMSNKGTSQLNRNDLYKKLYSESNFIEAHFLKKFKKINECFIPLRENVKHYYLFIVFKIKLQLLEIENQLIIEGLLHVKRSIFLFEYSDLKNLIEKKYSDDQIKKIIERSNNEFKENLKVEPPSFISNLKLNKSIKHPFTKGKLLGEPLSSGIVHGKVKYILNINDLENDLENNILLINHADPSWAPLISGCKAIIIETGGVLCHLAMIARELAIPAIILKDASKYIEEGMQIQMNANTGEILLDQ